MVHYLIEFRFQGKAKSELKRLAQEVHRKFNIRSKRRIVPHITLVAPFKARNEQRLIRDFHKLCSETDIMKFQAKGFGTFKINRVVYVKIEPGSQLKQFRKILSKTLKPYCELKSIDNKNKYYFHATIASRLGIIKFLRIRSYVKKQPKPNFKHIVPRVTLLKGNLILREYDFLQRKMLNRRLAKSRVVSNRTKRLLEKEITKLR